MRRVSRRSRSVVTITDVAQRAGVSPMTVSRVINGERNVREATREVVNAAVRELNYAPNLAARSLAKAEEVRIGVIYANPSAAYLSELLLGVLDETAGAGAQLLLANAEPASDEAGVAAAQRLIDGGVTGVVLPSPLNESERTLETLRTAGVSVVTLAPGRAHPGASCVRVDDRRAAFEMTRHLLALGHRRIGLVGGNPNQSSSRARRDGFEAALETEPGASSCFAQGYFDYASGLAAAEALLEAEDPPTAVFASNDDMAAAVVSVAHRRGLDVPGDLTVVGFDDTALATSLWPPLTTVRQPVRAMARVAIDLLVREVKARSRGEPEQPSERVLEHAIVERQSAAPPRNRAG